MPSLWKLALPVVLGIAAGAINWWVASEKKPFGYVQVVGEKDLRIGDSFSSKRIQEVKSSFEITSAIPWSQWEVLSGRKATRDYVPGDIVLRQDLMIGKKLSLREDQIAINVSLDGVSYEKGLLRVGGQVGFVVSAGASPDSSVGDDFKVLGPYQVVAVGSVTTPTEIESRRSGSTITVAIGNPNGERLNTDGAQLVQAKSNRAMVAIAFYPEEPGP